MIGMDQYELIRTAQRVYGKSIRQIARETGHHRETIRKALAGLEPQYRRRKEVRFPVMGPVAAMVENWLRTDQERPKKQRHTGRRVYTRLVEEYGFGGAESTVRRWVRECKARLGYGAQQAVLPLDPEAAREAEVDWGTAWVKMQGALRRVKLFCMRSRFSGKSFVRAYPWERQEMFTCMPLLTTAGCFPSKSWTISRWRCGASCGGRSESSRSVLWRFAATTPFRCVFALRVKAGKRRRLHTTPRCFVSIHTGQNVADP
ncbi:hypothetical protein MYX65_09515 [Acidobacteria bacterium AH-259-L09]|nr:hypothetical protein [Acidobacteria bacterium AH-259-L09]